MPRTRARLLCGALSVLPVTALHAADTNTWLGAPDQLGAFNDPTLWSLGVVPDGSTNVAIGAGGVIENAGYTNRAGFGLGSNASLILGQGVTLTNTASGGMSINGSILGGGSIVNASQGGGQSPGLLVEAGRAVIGVDINQPNFGSIGTLGGASLALDGITLSSGQMRAGNYELLNGAVIRDVLFGADHNEALGFAAGSTLNLEGANTIRGQLSLGDGTTIQGSGTLANNGVDAAGLANVMVQANARAVIRMDITQAGAGFLGGASPTTSNLVLDGVTITGGGIVQGRLTAENGARVQDVAFGTASHDGGLTLSAGSNLGLLGANTVISSFTMEDGSRLSGTGTLTNISNPGSGITVDGGRATIGVHVTEEHGGYLAVENGGTLVLDGATVSGGSLRGDVNNRLAALNGATVENVSFGDGPHFGAPSLASGSTLTLLGSNSLQAGFTMEANTSLIGTGTLRNLAPLNQDFVADGGRAVIGVNVTQGSSVIHQNVMRTENGGTFVLDGATVSGGFFGHGNFDGHNGAALQDVVFGLTKGDPVTLIAGSEFTGTGSLLDQGAVAQQGAFNLTAGSSLRLSQIGIPATWQVSGTMNNAGAIASELSGTLTVSGGGTINNTGEIVSMRGGAVVVDNGGTLNNAGTIAAVQGALLVQSGGTLVNSGSITNDYQSSFAVAAGGRAQNTGTMNLAGSAIAIAGELTNNGVITAVQGPLTGDPPIATPAPPVNIASTGLVSGTGVFLANVFNDGVVAPGDSVGTLSIHGNYTQSSNGLLNIFLGGSALGEFGVLDVSGLANLSGTLAFTTEMNFAPQIGDDFEFLRFADSIGDFGDVLFMNWSCPVEAVCQEIKGEHSYSLLIGKGSGGGSMTVPEPDTLALFAIGLGGLALMQLARGRRRMLLAA